MLIQTGQSIKNERGQSIVEALIALTAGVTIITAIAIAVVNSVNNADFAKNQNLATAYSQQALEIINVLRKNNWTSFSNLSGTYCLGKNSNNLTQTAFECGENVDRFIRTVVITPNASNCSGGSRVKINTSWTDGKCTDASNPYCHTVELVSCVTGVDVLPAP